MSRRLRVVAAAYACEPGLGSESGIGWNTCREMARYADVTVVTRENNVEAIRAAAHDEQLSLECVGHDLSPRLQRMKRGGRFAMPYYLLWQESLADVVAEIPGVDLVQHLTFASPWIPSGLSHLDLPFVFGPVGQHPRVPDRFLSRPRVAARWREAAKAWTRSGLRRFHPGVHDTLTAADVILSLGDEFERTLAPEHAPRVERMLAAGVDEGPFFAPLRERASHEPLEILFAGRLVDLKGARLALDAFLRFQERSPQASFTMIGGGPLEAALRARAGRAGARVTLLGKRSHAETLARMARAHVFLFPSFEGAGMVVPEAMASGCAPLVLDFGGPGEMVGDGEERGLRVSASGSPRMVIQALAAALGRLDADEVLRSRLAGAARNWARTHALWSAKAERWPGIWELACKRRRPFTAYVDRPFAPREAA